MIDPQPWEPAWAAEERRQCIRRVPELDSSVRAPNEFHGWLRYLRELDGMTAAALADDMRECETYMDPEGIGWREDVRHPGGAVFFELLNLVQAV